MTHSFTDLRSILIGLLLVAIQSVACALEEVPQEVPRFVEETIYSPNRCAVAAVIPSASADIVLLEGGLEQGLRRGMVCSIDRGAERIGELILIESRMDRSAALILDLFTGLSIQPGDIARIKTIRTY
ncbi:MAG: hypothetical protein CNE95_02630 [Puniceicoccaceae bacterium MED-G30]|jgi:hypothetical protein|nr:MAG: hypothetical protein CNE95_02630 [Puniceicoccaceae bacterium MED-G30]|tara:strand:+ start:873 stop:1256 length:384 start_codon:yes stop_codon:yes gene_type:complete